MAVITATPRQHEPPESSRVTTLPDWGRAIVTSDTDTYDPPVKVYVGGAGVVTATPAILAGAAGVAVTVPAGGMLPFRASKVWATGTTATLLVAVA